MTRKDFDLIAARIKYARQRCEGNLIEHPYARLSALDSLCLGLAADLASTNRNFNRARFLQACGYEE